MSTILQLVALAVYSMVVSASVDKVSFTNVGFGGSFTPVKKLSNIDSDSCTCEVDSAEYFSGANSPLADYLSVHFRGPLTLSKFAFYSSNSFVINNNRSSDDWSRLAYYDSADQISQNVTFLTKAGDDSPCLGKALTYASANGTGAASDSTILEDNNYISSDLEYAIFSNISCPSSGTGKGCGVYRDGIPAFYGFYGVTKMFLFEFELPTETQSNSTSFEYYDLPAIWLLNDHIPRTSQYPNNANCSCWASGCGEYDIFEAMNGTEHNNLYSTFHTYQGISDLGTGIQAYQAFARDTSNVMRGGVIFDSDGNVVSFLSSSTTFESTYSASDVIALVNGISTNETYSSQLASISAASTTSSKSKNGAGSLLPNNNTFMYYLATIVTTFLHVFVI
ncbi:hypothetical protein TPHA_0E03370 [Tetrapisispora phaffii CBS 4417]|uniref:glucan endo-1,3-beta-D-glucosidase n=1 Tax=Tetrapisispora phaffii (strain ATCC 24235 / CBS 4417 / NBRC 1672 / NRRL Y-8282 / UCD 70-5) TaxID=1071381 RepID=G8BU49_TETPH|nr:hypothetical protein TPHA_0E03370 [Tetrapisispora phaffii CBS 4417]CCE63427.1 hypothetical protein TPHA_0E03370 [Tetrapisispora phaffii CBS 4417]